MTRPTRTIERTRPQRVWSALVYLLLTGAATVFGVWLVVLARDLFEAGFPPSRGATVSSVLFGVALAAMTSTRMGVFHGVAKVLGGSAPFRTSVASVAYLQAVLVVYLPLSLTTWVPSLAPLVFSLAALAIEAFIAVNLTTAARQYHGLATGRAAAAAWAPFAFVLGVALLGCGFLGALLDASALPRATIGLESRGVLERDHRQAWSDVTRRCHGIVEERPGSPGGDPAHEITAVSNRLAL